VFTIGEEFEQPAPDRVTEDVEGVHEGNRIASHLYKSILIRSPMLLLGNFWWGSVFLLAVPVMFILLAAGPIFLPEYRHPENARLDLTSVGLSMSPSCPSSMG
jgi:hypothetical protein